MIIVLAFLKIWPIAFLSWRRTLALYGTSFESLRQGCSLTVVPYLPGVAL